MKTILGSRVTCARKGCRRWWNPAKMKNRASAKRKKYCCPEHQPSAKEYAAVAGRKGSGARFRDLEEDRVGSPLPNGQRLNRCERCGDRPSRKGYMLCGKCARCVRCGKEPCAPGKRQCTGCRRASLEKWKAYNKRRYHEDPVFRSAHIKRCAEYAKRRMADPVVADRVRSQGAERARRYHKKHRSAINSRRRETTRKTRELGGRTYEDHRRRRLLLAGLCTKCGRQPLATSTRCVSCRDKHAATERRRHARRKTKQRASQTQG